MDVLKMPQWTGFFSDIRRLQQRRSDVQRFRRNREEFFSSFQNSLASKEFRVGRDFRILGEWRAPAGGPDPHYLLQDLYVAKCIFTAVPKRHIDVGSSISGFVTHVASFRTLEVVDVRPLPLAIPGVEFKQYDIMGGEGPPFAPADSVSCLHVLEHLGLGRYGDELDPDGWRRGLAGLGRLLAPGGMLYLSVPVGREARVEFNAHRVFDVPLVQKTLATEYEVTDFSLITDDAVLRENIDPSTDEAMQAYGSHYGCGIWSLRKKSTTPQKAST